MAYRKYRKKLLTLENTSVMMKQIGYTLSKIMRKAVSKGEQEKMIKLSVNEVVIG